MTIRLSTDRVALCLLLLCSPVWAQQLASTAWVEGQGYSKGGASIPPGLITMILAGSCPAGWTESAALNGVFLQGTLAANGDVGASGGNTSITPTGTVSQPTFAGIPATLTGSVSAPTFTGSSGSTSAVSAGTPAGTVSQPSFTGTPGTIPAPTITWPANVPSFAGSALATHTHTFTGSLTTASATTASPKLLTANTSSGVAPQMTAAGSNAAVSAGTPAGTIGWPVNPPTNSTVNFTPAGTVGQPNFTGSALATHSHTMTPAGTNSQPALTMDSYTPGGTVSRPSFVGDPIDPRPAFVKVIFCVKN